jgi:GntR family transcriptional regulator, transcriptional repressor for pyruvate dehydrogenase complex
MRTGALQTPVEPKTRRHRVKLVDEIIESLRQEIVTRRLPDGERLPSEKELSDRFGVSQPTVREAIRALDTLGLLEVLHGSGSFVRSQGDFALASALQTLLQLQSVSVMEVLDIRQVLGRHSIEMAAANATEEDIAEIATTCARFENLADVKEVDDVIAHIISFQRAVSAASHIPLLQSLEAFLLVLLNEVQVQSLTGRSARFWRARAMDFQPHRVAILKGLRSGEPAVARRAMDRYFDAQRKLFERDENLRALNLSHPSLIHGVANMVRQFRT